MSSKRQKPPAPEPLAPLIDAHTHLDACGAQTPADVAAILDRAGAVGVQAVVTIADDLDAARWAAQRNLDVPTIALRLGVPTNLFRQWMRQHPEFAAAVTEGYRTADASVIQGLYKRAAGYEFENTDVTITEEPPNYQVMR